MNKCIFLSRITKDLELKYSQSGTAILKFGIAVNRKFKQEGKPTADFFNVTCFGKTAEHTAKYMKKGSQVVVEGRIENDECEKDK